MDLKLNQYPAVQLVDISRLLRKRFPNLWDKIHRGNSSSNSDIEWSCLDSNITFVKQEIDNDATVDDQHSCDRCFCTPDGMAITAQLDEGILWNLWTHSKIMIKCDNIYRTACSPCVNIFAPPKKRCIPIKLLNACGKFACPVCKVVFSFDGNRNRHIKRVHGIDQFKDSHLATSCKQCGKGFRGKLARDRLNSHLNLKLCHQLVNPRMCPICKREFRFKYMINAHMSKCHSNVKDHNANGLLTPILRKAASMLSSTDCTSQSSYQWPIVRNEAVDSGARNQTRKVARNKTCKQSKLLPGSKGKTVSRPKMLLKNSNSLNDETGMFRNTGMSNSVAEYELLPTEHIRKLENKRGHVRTTTEQTTTNNNIHSYSCSKIEMTERSGAFHCSDFPVDSKVNDLVPSAGDISLSVMHIKQEEPPDFNTMSKVDSDITDSSPITDDDIDCRSIGAVIKNEQAIDRDIGSQQDLPNSLSDSFPPVAALKGSSCIKCDKVYYGAQSEANLWRHILSCHVAVKAHVCQTCGMGFVYNYMLKNHIQRAHGDNAQVHTTIPEQILHSHSSTTASNKRCSKRNVCRKATQRGTLMQQEDGVGRNSGKNIGDKRGRRWYNLKINKQIRAGPLENDRQDDQSLKHLPITVKAVSVGHETSVLRRNKLCIKGTVRSCKQCGQVFRGLNSTSALRRHKLSHLEANPHACSFCSQTFVIKYYLKQHLLKFHSDSMREAEVPTTRAKPKKKLSRLQVHHLSRPVKVSTCDQCGKVYRGINSYTVLCRHKLSHGEVKPHVCNICGRSFVLPYELQKHQLAHIRCSSLRGRGINTKKLIDNVETSLSRFIPDTTDKRIVCCSDCDSLFTSITKLQQHEETHRTELVNMIKGERLVEPSSEGESEGIGRFIVDTIDKRIVRCSDCDSLFTSIAKLQQHEETHRTELDHMIIGGSHVEPSSEEESEGLEGPADKASSQVDNNHIDKTSQVSIITATIKPINTNNHPVPECRIVVKATSEVHDCAICKEKFAQKIDLDRHVVLHKQHRCRNCAMCFGTKFQLKEHMLTHGDVKYNYRRCRKWFLGRTVLDAPIRTHSRVKLFRCDMCCKRFHKKGQLVTHLKTHEGVRNYPCPICKHRFRETGQLEAHLRCHAGNDHVYVLLRRKRTHVCSACKKQFVKKSQLNRHLRKFAAQEKKKYKLPMNNGSRLEREPQFMCSYCLLEFYTQEDVKSHFIHTSCCLQA